VGLVHSFHAFLCVAADGNEAWRVSGKLRHALEGIPDDIAMDAIFLGESGRHGMYLLLVGLYLQGFFLIHWRGGSSTEDFGSTFATAKFDRGGEIGVSVTKEGLNGREV
jgi:hypothetical protein